MDWRILADFARKNIVPGGFFFHSRDKNPESPGTPVRKKPLENTRGFDLYRLREGTQEGIAEFIEGLLGHGSVIQHNNRAFPIQPMPEYRTVSRSVSGIPCGGDGVAGDWNLPDA
ncbi:MAG: hypothetical protein P4K94_04030, partial [Terracidiphilus sp.]|nr:hypothetical protein [Terracidiphilus sp.]